jgi:hypothetical protein
VQIGERGAGRSHEFLVLVTADRVGLVGQVDVVHRDQLVEGIEVAG